MKDELTKSAEIVITQCVALRKNENILVLFDAPERRIANALFEVGKRYANEAIAVEITPRANHGEEPPDMVAEIMPLFDVILIPTSRSLSHTDARRAACARGARIATLPGIIEDTFIRTLNADYNRIAELSNKLAHLLTEAKRARVVTDIGTDITMSLETRKGHADTGILHKPGDFSNLPAGEAYIAPLEGTAEGVYIVDGSMKDSGVLQPNEYITITVRDGYATEIKGGKSAEDIIHTVEKYGKDALNIAELGIGTNYKAKIIGNVLEDEKVLSTVHIAIGDNKSMGGNVNVPSHLDGIIRNPTLFLDDKMIMEKGEILV